MKMKAPLLIKTTAALAATTVVAGVSVAMIRHATDPGPGVAQVRVLANTRTKPDPQPPSKAFTINGNVTGLYPGATVPLVLNLANPESQAIVVHTLQVTVTKAPAGCATSMVTVAPFGAAISVPARAARTRAVNVTMSPAAGSACMGTFELTYSGQADQA